MTCVWILLALAAVIAGGIFVAGRFSNPNDMTGEEVANRIDNFLAGRGDDRDWEEFTSLPIHDPVLDAIRVKCAIAQVQYPPEDGRGWCSAEGRRVLRDLAAEARRHRRG